MIKYNTYKTVSRINLYGDKDELLNNPQSVYKTNKSQYKNCKKFKFSLNGSLNHLQQLSNNARLMLESSNIQSENLQTKPIIWYNFDDSGNIGLDSMGKVNAVKDGTALTPTYDNITFIRGVGSMKIVSGQTLIVRYNFSDISTQFTVSFWIKINSLNNYWNPIVRYNSNESLFLIFRKSTSNNIGIGLFGGGIIHDAHFVGEYILDNK